MSGRWKLFVGVSVFCLVADEIEEDFL
ncbi:uncharacterized protein METZ01_LOCUS356214, partial [marine metagenome]